MNSNCTALKKNNADDSVVMFIKDPLVKKSSYIVVKCERNKILKNDKASKMTVRKGQKREALR